MAMSGLDIFKLLPRTNCGDCGVPTCMAFAMKLAQKKAELGECPFASDEAKAALGAAAEPPIHMAEIGGKSVFEAGNETVLFRHEKTFVNQTGIAIHLSSSEQEKELLKKIKEIEAYNIERVGEQLYTDLFFLSHDTEDAQQFLKMIDLVKQNSKKGIILDCENQETLADALKMLKEDSPAVLLKKEITETDIEQAKANDLCLIISAKNFEDLILQTEKAKNAGVKNLFLNLDCDNLGKQLQNSTILRRAALKQNFKSFGFPLFSYIEAENKDDLLAKATFLLCKYSSLIVLPEYDKALLYSLFALRQNIYTDPQKPIQVEAKVYPIGEPTPESPVFVTTNFSLTYFMVSGEIENSGISAHLVIADVEGQSVLTAWAAGKFTGEKIAKFVKDIKLEEQIKTRKIIIPGFVAQISGDLEEALPGWEVIVGCQEASDIPSFIKNVELV